MTGPGWQEATAVGIGPIDHLLLVLEKAEEVGLSPNSIMRSCGLSYSLQDFRTGRITNIPQNDFLRLRQQCAIQIRGRLAPEGSFGLSAEDLDYMVHSLISSLDLREALKRQQRFHVLTDGRFGRSQLTAEANEAYFEISLGPAENQWAIFFETDALLVYTHLMAWLVGGEFPVAYELAFPDDRSNRSILDIFGVEAKLGAERSRIRFDAGMLDRPVVRTASELRCFMTHFPWGSANAGEVHTKVSVRVAALYSLAMMNESRLPTTAQLAERLGLGSATLRRYLEAEGTSIRKIKDELRFKQAARLLSDADLHLRTIAQRSGYRDDKAFIRAFGRRAGQSPGAFRSRQENRQ